MDEKSFELLTKMYSEFSEFRKDITNKVEVVSYQVVQLENGLKEDVKALYDGYKQVYKKLEIVDCKIDGMSHSIGKQDMEIKVLKGIR